ncbi:Cyclic nucleotide-binding domain-containing protein 2 [Paramecium bursaria]
MYNHKSLHSDEIKKLITVEFFQNLLTKEGQGTVDRCLEKLRIEKLEQNELVCKSGERGYKFYIILKGSVEVYLEQRKEGQTESILINTLKQGQSFGELALITSKPRLATIITREPCVFATLYKDDYRAILQNNEQLKVEQTVGFLGNVSSFSNFTERGLYMLYFCCKVQYLQRRYILYKAGQPALHIYIVLKGYLRLYRGTLKQQNVCLIGEYEIAGDYEALNKQEYEYTAECESNETIVFKLSRKDLQKVLAANFLVDVYSNIKRQAQIKHDQRLKILDQQTIQNRLATQRNKTEPIQSTRTLNYSEKYHTCLTDKYLIQANTSIIQKLILRNKIQRPIINITIRENKPKIFRARMVSDYSNFKSKLLQRTSSLL